MEGRVKFDYVKCVDIVIKGVLKEMVVFGMIVVIVFILVGILFGKEVVVGFLMIGIIVGVILVFFFNNGGGVWDNVKKFIEFGNYGGKRFDVYKVVVVGDIVGDLCKDIVGLFLYVFVKFILIIIFVFVLFFR